MTTSEKKIIQKNINHSIKKYRKTYELLEKYDKESDSTPKELSNSRDLQDRLRELAD